MPPVFFVSFPFILLLLLFKGANKPSTKPKPPKPSIEQVIDIIDGQADKIIIVRNKKS
ncbi:MAG: hypothetical protein F6K11_06500 [Leptolyngbya sp. SIO3F4]|nr:hypothetical protein [Leptolyngbya sp. SIO3F4]